MDTDGGTLLLAPHADDEVLGAFSFLRPGTKVLYAGIEDRPSVDQRMAEVDASAAALGFSYEVLGQPVNQFDLGPLIGLFESFINRLRPGTVLFCEPSYNQDHRAVYDAAIVATRPHDTNWRVNQVLVYEQPDSVLWKHSTVDTPSVFVEIDIYAKIEAYQRYESQVRGHRSPDTDRALAALRGAQIGVAFAEAFQARRIVLKPDS